MSSEPKRPSTGCAVFMLFIGWLVTAALTAFATFARPLLIAVLKRRAKKKDAYYSRFMLAYFTQATFDEVKPLLDEMGSYRNNRFMWTNWLIALAFANGRFDEARRYSDYSVQWLDAWLQENKGELRDGLVIYKKWNDRRFSTDNPLSIEETWELTGEVQRTGGSRARDWVQAHLTHKLLLWSAQKKDAPAERALRKLKLKRRPSSFEDLPLFDELAGSMGMLKADFERLEQQQEEELEWIVYGSKKPGSREVVG